MYTLLMKHILIILAFTLSFAFAQPALTPQDFETSLLSEINLARASPSEYVSVLRDYRLLVRNSRISLPAISYGPLTENLRAIDEAIAVLSRQKPLPALRSSPVLLSLSRSFLTLQQRSNTSGHDSPDGTPARVRAAKAATLESFGEALAYGYHDPRTIVIAFLVDDGVPSRSHRDTILSPYISLAGISIGAHPTYGIAAICEFAGSADPLARK
jgi:uncharacterized protein YkwD